MPSGVRRTALIVLIAAGSFALPVEVSSAPAVVRDVKTGRSRLPALTRPVPGSTNPTAGYSQPDTQVEPSIAVNPSNPLNAVTVYQEGRFADGGAYTNGYATTFDGGKTWRSGQLPKLTLNGNQGGSFERASDPVVAFGPKNVVYANSLLINFNANQRTALVVNVSKDGGRRWSPPVYFQDDSLSAVGSDDKNWIVVDTSSAPGHHPGRVYVVWDRVPAPVVYNYCDADCDRQENWLPNLQTIPGVAFGGQGVGAYPVVQRDGGLGIVILTASGGIPTSNDIMPGNELVYILAPAAGSTPFPLPLVFLPPINIAGNNSNGQRGQRASGGLPAAAVDPSNGTIYAVWDDARYRDDEANDAVISRSTDNGLTWTAPARINRGPADDDVDHYNVTVAVGARSIVHVSYRQRDESGDVLDDPYIDTFHVRSSNGGRTFTRSLRVNRVRSHMAYAAFSRGGAFEGDYNQLASAGGLTYIARCQAGPAYRGEPPALEPAGSSTLSLTRRGHQHQSNWVAVVRDD